MPTKAYEATYKTQLWHDDRPADGNTGITCAGLIHLEKMGFKEHQEVKVTVRIEVVDGDQS